MWALLLTLIPFAFSMAASPGPSNVLVLVSSTNFGFQRSLPLISGLVAGLALMILATGLGLSKLFESYPIIHTVLKTLSIVYLLYLAWKIVHSSSFQVTSEVPKAMSFYQGLFFQWVNPKAWIVVISIIATYLTEEHDFLSQLLLISFTFFIVAAVSTSLWAIFGTVFARFLQSPRSLRIFNAGLALTLVLSLIPMVA
jgi:threonine/homoserine/homoserine lactone efflux protein